MIKELTPEQYAALDDGAQAYYDRWLEEQKLIGPQMKAEGWEAIGDMIWWLHPPSRRSVRIDPTRWSLCHGFGAFEGEPSNHDAEGFLVCWSYHTEGGEPVDGEYGTAYGGLWTASYTTALMQARRMRSQIMEENPARPPHVQLYFDRLLERKPIPIIEKQEQLDTLLGKGFSTMPQAPIASHLTDCDGNGSIICPECSGEGSWHDCGEDCCCCLEPEATHRCASCNGTGHITCPGCD